MVWADAGGERKEWASDGKEVRTMKKKDFFNGVENVIGLWGYYDGGAENPLDGRQSGKSECEYSVLGQWLGLSPYGWWCKEI